MASIVLNRTESASVDEIRGIARDILFSIAGLADDVKERSESQGRGKLKLAVMDETTPNEVSKYVLSCEYHAKLSSGEAATFRWNVTAITVEPD